MKPKNFPARKMARKLGAQLSIPAYWLMNNPTQEIVVSRMIKTKKARG